MQAVGLQILTERHLTPEASYRMGFHVPPFNSVFHLHMHVIGLPLTCGIFSAHRWGLRIKPVEELLQELEVRNSEISTLL